MKTRRFLRNIALSVVVITLTAFLLVWGLERVRRLTRASARPGDPVGERASAPRSTPFVSPPGDSVGAPPPAVRTEAYTKIGAAEYHSYGYLGQDVTVGVIDTQFDGIQAAVDAGELPHSLTTKRLTSDGVLLDDLRTGAGAHGTACAEVIHDLAPEAHLYLLQVDDFLGTAEYVFDVLERADVRIVSVSLSVLAMGRADGSGMLGNPPVPIYRILSQAHLERDMLIVMSAGNYARQHYAARFRDFDGDQFHEFRERLGDGQTEALKVAAQPGDAFFIHMSWDDWGPEPLAPAANSDYDLFVYNENGRLVASSTIAQQGDTPPVESVRVRATEATTYAIRIRRAARTAGTHNLRMWVTGTGHPLHGWQTPAGSLGAPADAEAVVTVGAANVATGHRNATSSQGPTADGRIKPDVTSYAFVSVSNPAYGTRGFRGSSAATPHVAGIAALLMERKGSAIAAPELRSELLSFAADYGISGLDNKWGHGIVALPPIAPQIALIQPKPGDPIALDATGRATLILTVLRGDGSPISGLNTSAFSVRLDGAAGEILTAQDVNEHYVLRVRWPGAHRTNPEASLGISVLDTSITLSRDVSQETASEADPSPTRLVTLSQPRSNNAGDIIELNIAVENGAPVTDAFVVAEVTAPLGTRDQIILRDDGESGDGVAADGVYGGWYPMTHIPGRYTFSVTAYERAAFGRALASANVTADVATNLRNRDRDGLPESWENTVGLNYLVHDRLSDPDADGLANYEEFRHGSHPFNWDTDGDLVSDGEEVSHAIRTSPYVADSDLGGVTDGTELRRGTDPRVRVDDHVTPHRLLLPMLPRARVKLGQ